MDVFAFLGASQLQFFEQNGKKKNAITICSFFPFKCAKLSFSQLSELCFSSQEVAIFFSLDDLMTKIVYLGPILMHHFHFKGIGHLTTMYSVCNVQMCFL